MRAAEISKYLKFVKCVIFSQSLHLTILALFVVMLKAENRASLFLKVIVRLFRLFLS